MSAATLRDFLEEEQGMSVSLEECFQMVQQNEPDLALRMRGHLSFLG
jgi:hypothetical protein